MSISDVREKLGLPPVGDGGASDNVIDAAIGQAITEVGAEGMEAVIETVKDAASKILGGG